VVIIGVGSPYMVSQDNSMNLHLYKVI